MKTVEVEIWVLVDENGNYAANTVEDELDQRYAEEIGSTDVATRRIKVKLTVPLPAVVELSGVVPVDDSAATLSVA